MVQATAIVHMSDYRAGPCCGAQRGEQMSPQLRERPGWRGLVVNQHNKPPARARLQVQQQRCEGKAFLRAGTAEAEARQLRQQVTHLQEQRTVPLGRAPLVLGCRLAIRPSQPFLLPLCRVRDLVQGPRPLSF